MQPRNEAPQRCVHFELATSPRARVYAYRDPAGNVVHHFDIPARHSQLRVTAEATVEVLPLAMLPMEVSLETWGALDAIAGTEEFWEYVRPSCFVEQSELLDVFASELKLDRSVDPWTVLRRINSEIFRAFEYTPQSTQVDSPIDDALRARRGVCQDFAHVMLALVRPLGIPARYVSGYLYHGEQDHDRSLAGATHAWIEAWLPQYGWTGLDPTNDLIADGRHIRVAVGRDYADVPPTRGVFKGTAGSELSVAVQVNPSDAPAREDDLLPGVTWVAPALEEEEQAQQQQQQ